MGDGERWMAGNLGVLLGGIDVGWIPSVCFTRWPLEGHKVSREIFFGCAAGHVGP